MPRKIHPYRVTFWAEDIKELKFAIRQLGKGGIFWWLQEKRVNRIKRYAVFRSFVPKEG